MGVKDLLLIMVIGGAEDEVGRVQTITGYKEAVPSFWQVFGDWLMPALTEQFGQKDSVNH